MPRRDEATVRAELADLERHAEDAPPHHAGGAAELADRIERLRAELAALRRGGTVGDPDLLDEEPLASDALEPTDDVEVDLDDEPA